MLNLNLFNNNNIYYYLLLFIVNFTYNIKYGIYIYRINTMLTV